MNKTFENIINEGKKNGKKLSEINAELKAAGANFHLNPDGGIAGWTEQEMKEGFIPTEEETADVKHMYDYFSYNPANAGQTIRVTAPEGTYDITWDEGGHPVKAVRVCPLKGGSL